MDRIQYIVCCRMEVTRKSYIRLIDQAIFKTQGNNIAIKQLIINRNFRANNLLSYLAVANKSVRVCIQSVVISISIRIKRYSRALWQGFNIIIKVKLVVIESGFYREFFLIFLFISNLAEYVIIPNL